MLVGPVPEARSSRLHGPGGRSRAVGAGYGTYHPPRHPRWSCAETGEAGRGAWEATEVAGLPETRVPSSSQGEFTPGCRQYA